MAYNADEDRKKWRRLHEEELREKLADIEHQRWSDWQSYMHSKTAETYIDGEKHRILPIYLFEQWERQIKTPYKDLSEREKDSDREQVDRYFHLILELL